MELYLTIYVYEINISKHSHKLKDFDDLSDYHYYHCDRDLKEKAHPVQYYYISHCDGIFLYLDRFETSIPKNSSRVCWDWSAVRIGKTYYLSLRIEVCYDSVNEIYNAINATFQRNSRKKDAHEWPVTDFSIDNAIDEEWHKDEYDDDSELRILEHCTKGSSLIRWERPYPEHEGAGDSLFSQIASIATILMIMYQNYVP